MAASLWTSILAAQAELRGIDPTGFNKGFKTNYVKLDDVLDKAIPALNAHGLVLTQTVDRDGLTTTIVHAETGQATSSTMPLLLAKEDSQGQGSAITYARRYALMSVLALKGEADDDGEEAVRQAAAVSGASSPPKPLKSQQGSAGTTKAERVATPPPPAADPPPETPTAPPPVGDKINAWQITELKKLVIQLRSLDPFSEEVQKWDDIPETQLVRGSAEGAREWIDRLKLVITEVKELGPPVHDPLDGVPG